MNNEYSVHYMLVNCDFLSDSYLPYVLYDMPVGAWVVSIEMESHAFIVDSLLPRYVLLY